MPLRLTRFQVLTHIGALFPLGWLGWDYFQGNCSVNPIQDITLRTGKAALVLLVLSLACTPVNTLFGWRQAISVRRTLGLYASFYASIHFLIFIGLDYGFDWGLMRLEVVEKPYVWVGASALAVLLLLAITSTRGWKVRLRKNWKRLHRLAYLAAVFAIVHYAWVKKGNILAFQGDILQPMAFGFLVGLLLLVRTPPVKKLVIEARDRFRQRLIHRGIHRRNVKV
jgi:methionine sulfoxide reductase heme-binding subunit